MCDVEPRAFGLVALQSSHMTNSVFCHQFMGEPRNVNLPTVSVATDTEVHVLPELEHLAHALGLVSEQDSRALGREPGDGLGGAMARCHRIIEPDQVQRCTA